MRGEAPSCFLATVAAERSPARLYLGGSRKWLLTEDYLSRALLLPQTPQAKDSFILSLVALLSRK